MWGSIKKFWKQYLVFVLMFFLTIGFYLALEANPKTSEAIVAFGTMILALVTAISILNSNAQEKRRGEETLARENRDRKERLLNEIIEWAIDVSKTINEHMISMDLHPEKYKGLISFICNGIDQLITRGRYIYIISNIFSEKLANLVNETNKNFIDCVALYIKYKDQKYKDVFKI